MSERKDYYSREDVTSVIDVYNIYMTFYNEVDKIDKNIKLFETNKDQYDLIKTKAIQLKDKIIKLSDYYTKQNKAFNKRPSKEINPGFISFEENTEE